VILLDANSWCTHTIARVRGTTPHAAGSRPSCRATRRWGSLS
jgi:hypothetical protein